MDNAILSASLEDYLEAILHIVAEKQAARAKDIATRLRVHSSSVTQALQSLSQKGLVNYAPYDLITLTPRGTEAAKSVVRRHETLRDFFVKILSVDKDIADETACKMEHSLVLPILGRLIHFMEFVEACPRAGSTWLDGFRYYCEHEDIQGCCEPCISSCLEEVRKERQ
ncbi:MAG: metal-dependent transcriptional regulator [Candidatus Eisenbacteria sp.]|nr:metal-dependent transcriptional regulator [Candidatus Eisenbacteria bacterium]